jgi:hypothetical protein
MTGNSPQILTTIKHLFVVSSLDAMALVLLH